MQQLPTRANLSEANFGWSYCAIRVFLCVCNEEPMKRIAILALGLLIFTACKDDDDDNSGEPINPVAPAALIGIEGTSPNGISSLAKYNMTNQTVENNVFRKANINPMGSQLSDMFIDKERNQLVLLVPGSSKMIYADANTFEITKQIQDLMMIRKGAKVLDNLYYITSPEIPGFYVINANNGNVVAEIENLGKTNPTEISVWEDIAFICNTGDAIVKDSTVSIFRTSEDTLITDLMVGHSPNSMVIDEENQLWILCSGNFNSANPLLSGLGSLWKYNLDTMKMAIDSGWTISPDTVKYFTDNQLRPNSLTYNEQGKAFYYSTGLPTGNIVLTGRDQNRIEENPVVTGNYYAIAFDQVNQELYGMKVPADIETNGEMQVFDPVGNLKTSIRIGVKPNNVVFKQ